MIPWQQLRNYLRIHNVLICNYQHLNAIRDMVALRLDVLHQALIPF